MSPVPLDQAFKTLNDLYALFDSIVNDYLKRRSRATHPENLSDPQYQTLNCKKGCATCCTCNVTLTQLEAKWMLAGLSTDEKRQVLAKLKRNPEVRRYVPTVSTNQFARICMEGRSLPEEENDPDWGVCRFLENDVCSVYDRRPFGCRALLSTHDCSSAGYARVPEYILTLNNLWMQYIEHLDKGGFSGNLMDMLILLLENPDHADRVKQGGNPLDGPFVRNESIPILMIPPEHRRAIQPVLNQLNRMVLKQ